jgi:hypothetical protein
VIFSMCTAKHPKALERKNQKLCFTRNRRG